MANSYTNNGGERIQPGNFAYEMNKTLAKEILATRKGTDQNMDPQAFLRKVVNESFGIKGNCIYVYTV